ATIAAVVVLVAFASAIIYPTLPSLEALTDYQPKIPLRIYSADGQLIGEFGEDYVGVARAALSNFVSGGVRQGASTITMQVARNFFLSKEKTLTRKFNEMLLAF